MPRPLLPGIPGRLAEVSRWRRLTAALGAIGVVALAVGIILGTGLAASSKGASSPTKSTGSATVQRRDLVETDTESGTLSYANPHTVFNRLSGTITSLPAIGQVKKPGETLYKVDGAPVVLFDGTIPAYRDLSEGVSDGPDVQELKQNLVTLGFDPSHQITINQTYDAATAAAVDNWQSALGETQTGTVTLGQVVFLPGPQRVTSVDTVLGSTGGASGSGSGSSGSSGSGSATGASTTVAPARPEFVSLTTTPAATTAASTATPASTTPTTTTPTTTTPTTSCPTSPSQSTTTTTTTTTPTKNTPPTCDQHNGKPGAGNSPTQLAALLALLKAETLELKKSGSSASSGAGRSAGGASSTGAASGRSSSGGGGSGGGGAASSASGTSGGSATGSGSSGAATAQATLQTTSTQLVVTVDLDATKQAEAVVGEPVTVELPDGTSADGKITAVSPVAQTSSSSSSSSSGAAGGGGSSTPSATVPVTITLTGHRRVNGLDQAAVSVNFEQQKANNVLSVPVTALVATAGGGYAVQEAAAPQRLVPVTPGLFAAGYVQISGSGIFPGLQVTDSQG